MNRLITIFTLVFLTFSGYAQPDIENINWSSWGKTNRYFVSTQAISPNPVPPGKDITWDFTNLSGPAKDSISILDYGGNTPFSFDFSKANVNFARYYASTNETYISHYRKTQFDFAYMGDGLVGGGAAPFSYDRKMFKFPMAFNSSFKEFLF
ncbi:MAG: hypothetical protein IT243_02920 [Bacteroidia bacterium]|nr:hypothetical protein [Bacteroidia bacterium]